MIEARHFAESLPEIDDDSETDQRVWRFKRIDQHRWIGTANDVDGQVGAQMSTQAGKPLY